MEVQSAPTLPPDVPNPFVSIANESGEESDFISTLNPINFTSISVTADNDTESNGKINNVYVWLWPVQIAIFLFTLFGNIVVVYAVCAVKRFRRPVNFMLANLSIISLLIMVSITFLAVERGQPILTYGPVLCRLLPGIHYVTAPLESLTIAAISLERTRAARNLLEREGAGRVSRRIGLIWITAFAISLPQGLVFYEYEPEMPGFYKCRDRRLLFGSPYLYLIFPTVYVTVTILIPSLILTVEFCRLAHYLKLLMQCRVFTVGNHYQACQRRLIRNALLFTALHILVKVPAGAFLFLCRLPPELVNPSLASAINDRRRFVFGVATVAACFYPFIVFVFSLEIRRYFCQCGRAARTTAGDHRINCKPTWRRPPATVV